MIPDIENLQTLSFDGKIWVGIDDYVKMLQHWVVTYKALETRANAVELKSASLLERIESFEARL